MSMNRAIGIFLALATVLGRAGHAEADYLFTTLVGSLATGINDSGQIVGTNGQGAFLYSGGTYTSINVPVDFTNRFSETLPYGINNAGQVVGSFADFNAHQDHGFLLTSGQFSFLDVPASTGTAARGINNLSQVVGNYGVGSGGESTQYGFLLAGSTYTTLLFPGSDFTRASGINDRGLVVGDYSLPGGIGGGFLYDGRNYSIIDPFGSKDATATGINDSSAIVGGYVDGNGREHGFILNAGTYTTIDFPGAIDTAVFGINYAGQIVGQYVDSADTAHAFLATPVPEPSSILLFATAALSLSAWVSHTARARKMQRKHNQVCHAARPW
jgi:probable HAF family extracellular repeat protein